jgi:uncharacterized membrane protein YraQ (UPF0718 family)
LDFLPLLLFAFTIAGCFIAFSPQTFVRNWMGLETGLQGLLIGEVAGKQLPCGPVGIS